MKFRQFEYLHSLYESIIYRDIIARYKLSGDVVIKKLVFFLASNCSKKMTYNSLRKLLGIGSTTTVSDYCSYLENSYLCFFVNRYNDSIKSQLQSLKKGYFIDHGIAKWVGFRADEDFGRILENLVFLELKRRDYAIYCHRKVKECDFVVRQNGPIIQAIQVCRALSDPDAKQREIEGLVEALTRFSLTEGLLIAEDEEYTEMIQENRQNFTITIIPIWKCLLQLT